jgi:hypothetical protein
MITNENRLSVIEDFRIDPDLPKFQKKSQEWNPMMMSEDEFNRSSIVLSSNPSQFVVQGPAPKAPRVSWYKRWFAPKPSPPALVMSVEDFFKSIKNSTQELTVIQTRATGYETALLNAKKAGQKALVEKLSAGLNAFKMETQLLAIGLTRFVKEEDVVRFYKQSKKGLRLDWIRNFARPIPEDVTATKAHADELGIFDNYVVLHYDPQAKAFAETQEETAARKDPILFGLMKDRTQLYFVGDWIDEHCDLTLDQFAEVLGAGAVQTLSL